MRLFLLLLLCTSSLLNAQNGVWEWAINPAESGSNVYIDPRVTVDGFGNSFFLAASRGAAATPSIQADSGAFISRYNKSGQLTWVKKITGHPANICADLQGNVYVAGTHNLYNTGTVTAGAFLTKIDYLGNVVWDYKNLNTRSAITTLTVGPSGKIYVAGRKPDTLVIGNFSLTASHGLLVACFSPQGSVLWAKSGEIITDTTLGYIGYGNQIALDQNENVYTNFIYGDCPNWSCVYGCLLKVNNNGSYAFYKQFSSYNAVCNGIAIEPNGEIIMSHCLSAWTSGGTYVLRRYKADMSSYYWERIVAQWQCQGIFIDSRPIIDQNGNIYIAGDVGTSCNPWVYRLGFGKDSIVTDSISDIIVCRIDKLTGDYQRVWHIPGRNYDHVSDICIDKIGNCYAAGLFNSYYNNQTNDTLCFDNNCFSGGTQKNQLFLAKLKFSMQQINDDVGIKEERMPIFKLSPNPTSGLLYLSGKYQPDFVKLTDVLGRAAGTVPITDKGMIDLGAYADGLYIISLTSDQGTVSYKVIKRN